MIMSLLFLNWMLSLIFTYLNHPLSLGCILLMQTIVISMASTYLFMNSWFSYILFLIMIGGMLVMFIYMTSIAANEKFKLPNKKTILFNMMLLLIMASLLMVDKFYANLMNFLMNNSPYMNYQMMLPHLTKFFNQPGSPLMITLMIYLLITLIAIVKITKSKEGPLRQK